MAFIDDEICHKVDCRLATKLYSVQIYGYAMDTSEHFMVQFSIQSIAGDRHRLAPGHKSADLNGYVMKIMIFSISAKLNLFDDHKLVQ